MKPIKSLKAKHFKLIEMLVVNPRMTITEIAEVLGVTEYSAHVTITSPIFVEELNNRMHDVFASSVRKAVSTMVKLAEEGDYAASKYILDSAGYNDKTINLKTEGIEINICRTEEE